MLFTLMACTAAPVRFAASTLWERPQALAILHSSALVELGTGTLSPKCFGRLLAARSTLLDSLSVCVGAACASISVAGSAAVNGGGKWDAGKWVPDPLATAAKASVKLEALVAAEVASAKADSDAWAAAAGALDLETDVDEDIPEPLQALEAHLSSGTSVLPKLGAAVPLLRTIAWAHSTLRVAGLGSAPAYAGWVDAHAERWTALADACELTFDEARRALDGGALGLSGGSALSDVECDVALREAQTSASLLFAVLESVAADESVTADAAAAAAAAAAEEEEGPLRAAHEALEAAEPGYLDSETVFIRGVGWRDSEGQQKARQAAAESYLSARQEAQEIDKVR